MGSLIRFRNPISVVSSACVAGKKEAQGALQAYFDLTDSTDKFGKDTFEKAESEMQRLALNFALKKAQLREEDLFAVFAGDLMNQCVGSSYGMASFGSSFFGLYGACSTAAEGLILGSLAVESGHLPCVATLSSSHNSTTERQFRFPLEYGSQRPPTAQWTATAAGAFILGRCEGEVMVTEALAGRIVDKGIADQSNMGAAMAPAAASTLFDYFCQSDYAPSDFDMILTGDLGREGHAICKELLLSRGLDLGGSFYDCGMMLYNRGQDTHCGGSGCGCSASVTAGYVMDAMRGGRAKEVLLVGTGALMSPSSVLQGLSIAGIGHLVHFSAM
jgi:stage V sporulation protein AD